MQRVNAETMEQWHAFARDRCAVNWRTRASNPQAPREGFFKQYMIEAHTDAPRSDRSRHDKIQAILRRAAEGAYPAPKRPSTSQKNRAILVDAIEPFVFWYQMGDARFVADCRGRRFWALETVDNAAESEGAVRAITRDGAILDQLWLPMGVQEALPRALGAEIKYVVAGSKSTRAGAEMSKHDGGYLGDEESERADDDNEYLDSEPEDPGFRSAFSGTSAAKALLELRKNDEFRSLLATHRSTLRRQSDDGVGLSTVWYSGKLTHRGTDWAAITETMRRVVQSYTAGIAAVEKLRIGTSEFGGDHITFHLSPASGLDPDTIVSEVFARRSAFKLLMTWKQRVSATAWVFDGVDLHTGDSFQLTMTTNASLRLHLALPDTACANLVPRLLSNLQQYVDATATCPAFEVPAVSAIDPSVSK